MCILRLYLIGVIPYLIHLGLQKTSSSSGWFNLGQAQLKMHRYSDSVASCSKGNLIQLTILILKLIFKTTYGSLKKKILYIFLLSLGLATCESGDKELIVRLQRLKMEALVRCGGEKAADEALETFSQVIYVLT